MSIHKHDDDCLGCLPAILSINDDGSTGEPLPHEHPYVVEAVRIFRKETTLEQREAWHRVTCLNSRDPSDVQAALEFGAKLSAALEKLAKL